MSAHWRPVTRSDVSAWADLLADGEAHEPTGEYLGPDDLLDELADPNLNLAEATTSAWLDGRMVAYGVARVRDAADSVHQLRVEAMVHPKHRETGLGQQLLDRITTISERLHRSKHPHADLEIHTQVHANQRWLAHLLGEAGFAPARLFIEMGIALPRRVIARPLPEGTHLVGYTEAYDELARQARNDAFAGHWGSTPQSQETWRYRMLDSPYFQPELSYLVLSPERDEVVAFVLCEFYSADHAATGRKVIYIADLGTRAAWRGRGLASGLIERVLTSAVEHDYQGAALSVDTGNASGALGLYTHVGFAERQRWTTYVRREGVNPGSAH